MTQIKRPVKPSPFRLVRVLIIFVAVLALAVVLYQIDTFARRKRSFHMRPTLTSPDQLFVNKHHPGLRQPKVEDRGESSPSVEFTGDDGEKVTSPENEKSNSQEEDTLLDVKADRNRRIVHLHLGGLEDKGIGVVDDPVVVIETHLDWAPLGVTHFHKLVDAHFYDQARFFRVLPNFVVQFGIAADPTVQAAWKNDIIVDDPVLESNKRGTVTFATSGKDSRTTQMFINLKDNTALDRQGFSPIGKVILGMEYVEAIVSKYREQPKQPRIVNKGNEYLQEEFPNLSYIVSIEEEVNGGMGPDRLSGSGSGDKEQQ